MAIHTLRILLTVTACLSPLAAQGAAGAVERRAFGQVVLEIWSRNGAAFHRLSLDGGASFGRARELRRELMLRYAQFDPLRDGEPAVPAALRARADGELFVVQYLAQGLHPWREEIRGMGAVERRFLAHHASVWRMAPELADRVRDLPFVRWVGAFHPAYKLEETLLADLQTGALRTGRYNLVASEWGGREKQLVAAAVRELGGVVHVSIPSGWILEATLTPEQLRAVAAMDEILAVDRWGPPGIDMNNVRILMGADYLEQSVPGLDGSGVRGEVMDQGLDGSHSDWALPPLLSTTNSGIDAHGTCTYGINFSAGVSHPDTRGMLPGAQGVFGSFLSMSDRYAHTSRITDPAGPYRVVFQSNSWGGPRTTQYTSISRQMDDVIFLHDLVITQSHSNSGTADARPESWAKNVISVGAVFHFDDTIDTNDAWNGGSSIGPAADGRIKPDLCAYYDAVHCSDAEPGGYVAGEHYTTFGGSSAATPIVAGCAGLLHQLWHLGAFGNPTGATVFDSRPHNSLAKALLVNTAKQYPFSGANHDLTRVHQGWGRPDLAQLYDRRDELFFIDESEVLRELESARYTVTVAAGAPELRATLVYVDRAGTVGSSVHRVNDLSLRVTSPSGVAFWGNNGLLVGNFSTAGGSSNTIDTVENVVVPAPETGDWIVEVFADEVNEDTHAENGVSPPDADFALVVRPARRPHQPLLSVSGLVAGGAATVRVERATPLGAVLVGYSTTGAGPIGTPFGLADLSPPITTLAPLSANAAGVATRTQPVPAGTSGVPVWIHAADVASATLSNSLARVIG